ncbi:MAG TPA: permease [Firmicutes bacterium]|nr:permease [Bacillota bacterium]
MLQGGIAELGEYLSAHVLTCLVPAFFIAGGIAALLSTAAVLKYFGPQTKKYLSYGVASVSGAILAVCSCTVLPLFAGIYKKGAGLGPAIAFLYSGPAINVLAIVLTARAIGFPMGLARALGAILFSLIIGLIMAALFAGEEAEKRERALNLAMFGGEEDGRPGWQLLIFFGLLVAILLFGTAKIPGWSKLAIIIGLVNAVALVVSRWFRQGEFQAWMQETWRFVRMIFPVLLVGVFVAGALKAVLPQQFISRVVGGNSLMANLVASVFGAFMYFSTLTEVPIVKALMDMGMGQGPALALLLAGPALSLPSMLALRNIMGTKKTAAYVSLVVVMATLTGMIFGSLA